MGLGFYLSVAMIPVMSILAVIFFIKRKVNTAETKIYNLILIVSILMTLFEILSALLYVGYQKTLLYDVVAKLVLLSYITVNFLFCYYLMVVCKRPQKSIKLLIMSTILVLITTIITTTQYVESNGSIAPQGIPVMLTFGYAIVLGIYQLILTLKNRKVPYAKKFAPFYLFLVFGGINTLIILIYPTSFMVGYIWCLTIIIMNFTIENPDVKMLEEMTVLKDQADKANNAKSEFLSNMSHEIRTPLNAIVGFSESLKEDNLPSESLEKVEDIIMASNNLLEIVNGILDISKIEANKLEIIEKEYEIDELWNELIILTKARIGDRGIDFRVNIDPTIPKVLYGDNTRLKQVILNILTNAAKYTKEGYIDFKVSSIVKDNMIRLIITVEDTGIGIKEENLPRLFSKFDRLSVEKKLTIEGTGLGLAITKRLVELMHGKIVVQSVYGKGSKFTISIDQKIISNTVQHQKETTESSSKVFDVSGAKILLVDDNELNLKVATTLLKKYNLNIETCISGFACIEKINNGSTYDLIFLDDMMPKMSGKETLTKLKNINGFNIPVIALTANAIEGMKEEYLSAGFTDYLSKPIQKTELEKVLRNNISNKNTAETNTINASNHTSIIADSISLASPDLKNTRELRLTSTAELDLPKKIEGQTDTNPVKEEPKQNDGYVLVVDDNDINLKVAKNTIGKYVSKLDTASSGSEAIERVIENKYDIIFMDDMMPDLDGPHTLDNLYTLENFNTPTILMTANELDNSIKEKIEKHKFADYLSKPIDKEKLINILTKYIK